MKTKQLRRLGERELDIMQALWELGHATVTDVHKSLLRHGHEIAYTTVQTMLNRLEGKHLVVRDQSDRAHLYRPVLKEPSMANDAIGQLTNRFFKGSVEGLVTRLVEKELDREQLKRLQALIDDHRRNESKR